MSARLIDGTDNRFLIICDHASNQVPEGVDLGVAASVMEEHVAYDIGAAAVSEKLAKALSAPAWMATISRLVVDVNRTIPTCVVEQSDGKIINGNVGLKGDALAQRHEWHRQFHDGLAQTIETRQPRLLISVHSFTPELSATPADRPWPIAVLWNEDERASVPAIAHLQTETDLGGPVGLNEPYSGKTLNYTMDRHGEDKGIAYLGLEIRQDLIADDAGTTKWAAIVERCVRAVAASMWAA